MSWYVHPSKQLRDDELPPELVVTNRDGSIEQVYVPYNASAQLEAENDKLREFIGRIWPVVEHPARWCERCEYYDKCIGDDEDGSRYRVGCRWREDRRAEARELGILEDA